MRSCGWARRGRKQHDYAEAVKAYDTAADRYNDQPTIAADAMYRSGLAWEKQADTAEYDQGAAAQAISAYTDFMTFYPDDQRVAAAQKAIAKLKTEQVQRQFRNREVLRARPQMGRGDRLLQFGVAVGPQFAAGGPSPAAD